MAFSFLYLSVIRMLQSFFSMAGSCRRPRSGRGRCPHLWRKYGLFGMGRSQPERCPGVRTSSRDKAIQELKSVLEVEKASWNSQKTPPKPSITDDDDREAVKVEHDVD